MRILNKFSALLLALLLLAVPLAGCAEKDEYQYKQIFDMDTSIGIYINASQNAEELLSECEDLIYSIEDKISKTRPGSDVYRLNSGEHVECDEVTLSILDSAKKVYELSFGAFDPTVAGLVSMWKDCEEENALPSEDRLAGELSLVGFDKISIDNGEVSLAVGVQIDLGGIG